MIRIIFEQVHFDNTSFPVIAPETPVGCFSSSFLSYFLSSYRARNACWSLFPKDRSSTSKFSSTSQPLLSTLLPVVSTLLIVNINIILANAWHWEAEQCVHLTWTLEMDSGHKNKNIGFYPKSLRSPGARSIWPNKWSSEKIIVLIGSLGF